MARGLHALFIWLMLALEFDMRGVGTWSSTYAVLPGYWRHLFNIAATSKRGGFCLQRHLCHLNFLLLLKDSSVPHITAYVDRAFGNYMYFCCSLRDSRVQILNVP